LWREEGTPCLSEKENYVREFDLLNMDEKRMADVKNR